LKRGQRNKQREDLEFDFNYDGLGAGTLAYNNLSGIGRGGTGTLKVDGKVVATEKVAHTLPMTKPLDTVVNIADATLTPVDDKDYQIPFPFTGKINKIAITVEPPQLSPADIKKLQEAEIQMESNK